MKYQSHVYAVLMAHAVDRGYIFGCFDPHSPNTDPKVPRGVTKFDADCEGIPLRVCITDWRFDEARVSVAAWPTANVDRWIECSDGKRRTGEVTVHGYLERGPSHFRLTNIFEPYIFLPKRHIAEMRSLPIPDRYRDRFGLYPYRDEARNTTVVG